MFSVDFGGNYYQVEEIALTKLKLTNQFPFRYDAVYKKPTLANGMVADVGLTDTYYALPNLVKAISDSPAPITGVTDDNDNITWTLTGGMTFSGDFWKVLGLDGTLTTNSTIKKQNVNYREGDRTLSLRVINSAQDTSKTLKLWTFPQVFAGQLNYDNTRDSSPLFFRFAAGINHVDMYLYDEDYQRQLTKVDLKHADSTTIVELGIQINPTNVELAQTLLKAGGLPPLS